ncbi:A disintegrin and metalloproteinase with thrombospondin motifs 7 [Varanus komodoensis]|nr:A disintegrin and metalloproteinase with thrombospondin motifs 7 [Varanus komodoensis]
MGGPGLRHSDAPGGGQQGVRRAEAPLLSPLLCQGSLMHSEKQREKWEERQQKRRRLRQRSVSKEKWVETLVVADAKMVQHHGSEHVEKYVLTVMNMVAGLFHDASIGNPIHISIVRLISLEEEEKDLKITHHADNTLRSFCKWQKAINIKGDAHPLHHDVAVLLTRKDLCTAMNHPCETLGLSHVSGMCQPHRSCNINEDTGLPLAFTVAHELGHSFGIQHDGSGNDCEPVGKRPFIMSPQLLYDTSPLTWSHCSREYITRFLDRGWGLCLDDPPAKDMIDFLSVPPGVLYDVGHQCRLQYGPYSTYCDDMDNVCSTLWCSVGNTCHSKLDAAVDGTRCDDDKWCFDGECVRVGHRPEPVDGGWAAWSSWAGCSRTCGGGVQNAERQCSSPTPKYGGKFCLGERKRFRVCSTQPCPAGKPSFRHVQCSYFDARPYKGKLYKWTPVPNKSSPCELHCRPENGYFAEKLRDAVADGTPCYEGSARRDLCINGICKAAVWNDCSVFQNVGCDYEIDSYAVEDRCGMCRGDGSTCQTVKRTFEEREGRGYVDVGLIPAGAREIQIEEVAEAENFLALRSEDPEKYFLNGGWTIQWNGDYQVAGTTFTYKRTGNWENLTSPGPTEEPVWIQAFSSKEPKAKSLPPSPFFFHNNPASLRLRLHRGPCLSECGTSSVPPSVPPENGCNRRMDLPIVNHGTTMHRTDIIQRTLSPIPRDAPSTSAAAQTRRPSSLANSSSSPLLHYDSDSEDLDVASTSLDVVITTQGPSSPEESYSMSGELMARLVRSLEIEAQRHFDPGTDKFHNIVKREQSATIILPHITTLRQAMMEPWNFLNQPQLISRRYESMYQVREQHIPFLLRHPRPNLIIMELSQGRESQLRISNYEATLARYQYFLMQKLENITASLPEQQRDVAHIFTKEAMQVVIQQLSMVRHHVDCDLRARVGAVALRRHAWLQNCNFLDETKHRIEIMPFDSSGLFNARTDHKFKTIHKSHVTAHHMEDPNQALSLTKPPLKPLATTDSDLSSRKTAFLVALTSARRARELCVLRTDPPYLHFHKEKLLFQEKNPGIRYQYTIQREADSENEIAPAEFFWQYGSWTACTASCGTGVQRQTVRCTEKVAGVVEDRYCGALSRPDDKQRSCGEEPCPARWWTGEWQACSATCGDTGLMRRTILCIQSVAPDEQQALPPSECQHLPRPDATAPCNRERLCPAQWATGNWTQCSVTCGSGTQERPVRCPGGTRAPCDAGQRPVSRAACSMPPCGDRAESSLPDWSGSGSSSRELFNEIHFLPNRHVPKPSSSQPSATGLNVLLEDNFPSSSSRQGNVFVDDFYYDYNFINFHEDLSLDPAGEMDGRKEGSDPDAEEQTPEGTTKGPEETHPGLLLTARPEDGVEGTSTAPAPRPRDEGEANTIQDHGILAGWHDPPDATVATTATTSSAVQEKRFWATLLPGSPSTSAATSSPASSGSRVSGTTHGAPLPGRLLGEDTAATVPSFGFPGMAILTPTVPPGWSSRSQGSTSGAPGRRDQDLKSLVLPGHDDGEEQNSWETVEVGNGEPSNAGKADGSSAVDTPHGAQDAWLNPVGMELAGTSRPAGHSAPPPARSTKATLELSMQNGKELDHTVSSPILGSNQSKVENTQNPPRASTRGTLSPPADPLPEGPSPSDPHSPGAWGQQAPTKLEPTLPSPSPSTLAAPREKEASERKRSPETKPALSPKAHGPFQGTEESLPNGIHWIFAPGSPGWGPGLTTAVPQEAGKSEAPPVVPPAVGLAAANASWESGNWSEASSAGSWQEPFSVWRACFAGVGALCRGVSPALGSPGVLGRTGLLRAEWAGGFRQARGAGDPAMALGPERTCSRPSALPSAWQGPEAGGIQARLARGAWAAGAAPGAGGGRGARWAVLTAPPFQCSATCGLGAIWRTVRCSSGVEAECDPAGKPSPARRCYLGPCAAWRAGAWSKCSKACGGGVKLRDVHCADSRDQRPLRPFHCQAVPYKPPTQAPCHTEPCLRWYTSPWRECSEPCGAGEQERLVTCPEVGRCDEAARPDSTRVCNTHPCTKWTVGSWGQCTATCGGGIQRRQVKCVNTRTGEAEEDSGQCGHELWPESTQKCNPQDCADDDPKGGLGWALVLGEKYFRLGGKGKDGGP